MKKSFWFVCFVLVLAIFGGFFAIPNSPVVAKDYTQAFYAFEKQVVQVAKNDDYQGVTVDKNEDANSVRQKIKNFVQTSDGVEIEITETEKKVDWTMVNRLLENNGYYSVEVDGEISIYHKYSLKRLIVFGDVKNTYGANQVISGYKDITVLCYKTQEQTQAAYNHLIEDNVKVYADKIMTPASYNLNEYDYSSNLNWGAEAIDIGGYREYLDDKAVTTSKQMVVVVLDTGLNTSHDFLKNRTVKDGNGKVVGYSYYTSTYTYSGYDFEDDQGHGTHVAGIICDLTPSNVKILPIKVLDVKGRGSTLYIMSGLERINEIYSKDYKVACLNMSLGGGYTASSDSEYYEIFEQLRNKNILPVVAAGNDSEDASNHLPAACDNAITVSSLKKAADGVVFDLEYSNFGEDIDVAAPGTDIYSTYISHENKASNAYATKSGTSMATPQVAGAVALLCLDPIYYSNGQFTYTADQIQERLYDLALDCGDQGWDEYYGNGVLNIRYFETKKSNATITFYRDGEVIDTTYDYIQFSNPFTLTMQCSDPSLRIFYTTDYLVPNAKNEKEYVAPLNVDDSIFIYAIGYKFQNGDVVEVTELFKVSFFYINGNIEDYIIIDNYGSITDYIGHFRELIVPEYIRGIRVESVYVNAFAYCDAFAITLPESCKSMAGYSFMNCKNLQYFYGPGISKTYIYGLAFNPKITFVTSDLPTPEATQGAYLPSLAESMGGAFYDCENLEHVKLENFTVPGEVDFAYCANLKTCELPNATIIARAMFYDCPSMETFKIGKNVQKFGDSAFGGNKLKSFTLEAGNTYLYTDGQAVYSTTTLLAYACASVQKNFEIKSSVRIAGSNYTITMVGAEALVGVVLDSLTIPSTITVLNLNSVAHAKIGTLYYNSESGIHDLYYFEEENAAGPPFNKSEIDNVVIGANVKTVPQRLFLRSIPKKVTIMSMQTKFEEASLYMINEEYDMYLEFETLATQSFLEQLREAAATYKLENLFVKTKSAYISNTIYMSYKGTYDEYYVYSSSAKTITVSTSGNGTVSPSGDVAILKNGERTFTITPGSGYVIDDILLNGKSVGASTTYTVAYNGANQTLLVKFTDKAYSIIATATTGGSISPSGKTNYKLNDSATYTIKANVGYLIKDVLVDNVSVGVVETYTFTSITQSHTIDAVFEKITFIIEVTCGENGSISPAGNQVVVDYGQNQTFSITADMGYKIKDVVVDGESKGAIFVYTFTNVLANHTISAEFERIYVTVDIQCDANGSTTPSGLQTIGYGEDIDVIIIPNTGYKVKDILVNGKSVGAAATYVLEKVIENATMYVEFEKMTFTITVMPGVNGSITPEEQQTVEYGASKIFLITPDTGFAVKNVYVNGEAKGQLTTYTFENVTSNQVISAEFEKLKFVISVIADMGGSITPSEDLTLEYGQNKIFLIVPEIGYKIKDVTLDGFSLGNVSSYQLESVTANHTLYASFEKIKFNITVQVEGKGEVVLANGSSVDYGSTTTIQFLAEDKHELKSVYVNGELVEVMGGQITLHNIVSNQVLNVKFIEKTDVTTGVVVVGIVLLSLGGIAVYFVIKRKRRMF